MPIKDGFQASLEIRKLIKTTSLQPYIVALTAYTTDNFKEKSKASKMDNFINKPVDASQIKQILSQLSLYKEDI